MSLAICKKPSRLVAGWLFELGPFEVVYAARFTVNGKFLDSRRSYPLLLNCPILCSWYFVGLTSKKFIDGFYPVSYMQLFVDMIDMLSNRFRAYK